MRAAPFTTDAAAQVPLVGAHHGELGGLADHRAARQRPVGGPALLEVPRAQSADLLVVREEQHQRLPQAGGGGAGEAVGRDGQEALHVGAATRVTGAVALDEPERRRAPPLARRDGVHVPRQHQAAAGGGVDLRPSSTTRLALGAPPGAACRVTRTPGRSRYSAEEVRERQGALAAGRVEADEPGEELPVGQEGGHGWDGR